MKFVHYTNCFPYVLELTSRVIQEAINRDFKKNNLEISHMEFVVLDTIYCNEGILQIDLAKKLLKTRAHTGKFLNALLDKGLIERKKAIKGSRQVIMKNYLTEKGLSVHTHCVEEIKKYIDNTLPKTLKDDDVDKLVAFLLGIKQDVEKRCNINFD